MMEKLEELHQVESVKRPWWEHLPIEPKIRNATLVAIVTAVGVVGVGLLMLSPWVLRRLSTVPGLDWAKLGNVSQTYSAAATLITALALGGVVVSLFFQAQDTKTAREQCSRTLHFALAQMQMQDPVYLWATGAPWLLQLSPTADRLRQAVYVNLWVTYWRMLYRIGHATENGIRALLSANLFSGEVGRQRWAAVRNGPPSTLSVLGRRDRRFYQIVDEEYRKACASGPPSIPAEGPEVRDLAPPKLEPHQSGTHTRDIMVFVGIGFLAGCVLRRK
jgi:Family of unknown function (DUF6082)